MKFHPLFLEQNKDLQILNIAAVNPTTRTLGPGVRAGIWVQGCALRCPGCIAPEWIAMRPARLIDPKELARQIMSDSSVTGLTLSGGEPMLQASGLAAFVHYAKQIRDVSVISFSGYRLSQLVSAPPSPGVETLLSMIDVLIDGPYLEARNDNLGLRGSNNQQIHHFTSRLADYPFETAIRNAEINILDGEVMIVGVPNRSLNQAFNHAANRLHAQNVRKVYYERT